jgi:hypothetical protein
MPQDIQPNGLLSQLVGIKAQKQAQDKLNAIQTYKSILGSEDATEGMRQYAGNSMLSLIGQEFGGGGKGAGAIGGKGGKDGAGNPIVDLFKHVIGKAVSRGGGQRQQGQQPQPGQQPPAPDQRFLTREQIDAQKLATQAKIDAARVKLAQDTEAAKNRADQESLKESAAGLREVRKQDLKEAGIGPEDPRYQEYLLYGDKAVSLEKKAQAKPAAGKAVQVVGPDGKQFTGFQRQDADGSMQLYKLGSTAPLDPAQYAEATKEPAAETGSLKQLVEAHEIVDNPGKHSQAEVEAAKDALQNAKLKQQSLQVNIKNAADTGSEVSDDDLRALAQTALLTGSDPHIVTRNPALNVRYLKTKGEEILKQGGSRAAAAGLAEYHADKTTLSALTKVQSEMQAALDGTKAEIKRVGVLAQKVPRSSISKFNSVEQFIDANLTDDPQLAAFREALLAARYRYNSMISNLRGGGAATNQVRTETADEILNRFMPSGAMDAALKEMGVGLQNIMSGMDGAVSRVKNDMRTVGGGATGQTARPQTKADFDALASGTVYIDPKDGKQYRKP